MCSNAIKCPDAGADRQLMGCDLADFGIWIFVINSDAQVHRLRATLSSATEILICDDAYST